MPTAVLVDFVKKPRLGRWQFALQDSVTVRSDVVVQVRGRILHDHFAKLCFAHLSRPADENHLTSKIIFDERLKISGERSHGLFRDWTDASDVTPIQNYSRVIFSLW